jgi:hypothetical protein
MPDKLTANEQITTLLTAYNIAIDSGDVEGFLDTFAPDGIFDGVHGRFEGQVRLREFINRYWADDEFARLRGAQHWINNLQISVHDDIAICYCYGTVLSSGTSGNQVMGTWHYNDQLIRIDGRWKFAVRYVRPFTVDKHGSAR